MLQRKLGEDFLPRIVAHHLENAEKYKQGAEKGPGDALSSLYRFAGFISAPMYSRRWLDPANRVRDQDEAASDE